MLSHRRQPQQHRGASRRDVSSGRPARH